MSGLRMIFGLVGTVVIAGWVAYAVSAPRNVDAAMQAPMDSLGGSSIAQEIAEAKAEVRSDQCERFTALASEAWDRAVEQDTTERDQLKLDELDRQVARYCN